MLETPSGAQPEPLQSTPKPILENNNLQHSCGTSEGELPERILHCCWHVLGCFICGRCFFNRLFLASPAHSVCKLQRLLQDLAQRVLRRLGYLDDDLNSDLPEAIQARRGVRRGFFGRLSRQTCGGSLPFGSLVSCFFFFSSFF